MTDDDPREPEYDPESAGLPDTADPDSTAFDEQESVREADGDPVLWPDDRPVALDESDTSGEPSTLDELLAREVPDFGAEDDPRITTGPDEPVDDDADDGDDEGDDESDDLPDPYADDEAEDLDTFDGSLEDDEVPEPFADDEGVGRLAEPDDDGTRGLNNRTVGEDVGLSGGGSTAEESAMHVVEDEDEDNEEL